MAGQQQRLPDTLTHTNVNGNDDWYSQRECLKTISEECLPSFAKPENCENALALAVRQRHGPRHDQRWHDSSTSEATQDASVPCGRALGDARRDMLRCGQQTSATNLRANKRPSENISLLNFRSFVRQQTHQFIRWPYHATLKIPSWGTWVTWCIW